MIINKIKQSYKFSPMILLFSFFGVFGQNKSTIELKSGQVWKYHTRKGEEKSRVIVLKVEDYKERGQVIHIAIHGLKIKNEHIKGGVTSEIKHLPFDRKTIEKSLIELDSTIDKLPNFMDGYLQWKEAFDNQKGGVFTMSIKEVINFVDTSINQ